MIRVCILCAVSLLSAHVRTCLVYVTRNLSTKNIFCQQKKRGNYIGQVYAANLFVYLGMENIFWSLQNYLDQNKIFWSWPKSGLDLRRTGQLISVQLAVHARSRSTMIRVIVRVILAVEFSITYFF